MGRTPSRIGLLVGPAFALAGCGGGGQATVPSSHAPTTIRVTSPAFASGAAIPRRFTCAGAGAAPPLRWSGVPARARALALTVEDPDAPGGTFVHWIVFDIPASARGLAGTTPPPGAHQARNSAGSTGWTPPCAPPGRPHHYLFTLYALDAPLSQPNGTNAAIVRAGIARAAVARGQLVGSFSR